MSIENVEPLVFKQNLDSLGKGFCSEHFPFLFGKEKPPNTNRDSKILIHVLIKGPGTYSRVSEIETTLGEVENAFGWDYGK